MLQHDIRKELKSLGSGKTLETIKKQVNSNSADEKQVCTVFKECSYFIQNILCALTSSEIEEYLAILEECLKFRIVGYEETVQYERYCFFIMSDLIRLQHINECGKLATYIIQNFEMRIGFDKSNITHDFEKILKNCYSLLWNHGKKLASLNIFDIAEIYFVNSLKFSILFKQNLTDIISQVTKVATVIKGYPNYLDRYQNLNTLLLTTIEMWPNIPDCDFQEIANSFVKWATTYCESMERGGLKFKPILYQLNVLVKKISNFNPMSFDVAPVSVCSKCVAFLNSGLEIASAPHDDFCKKLIKLYLQLLRIFTAKFCQQNKSLHQLALGVSRILVNCIPASFEEWKYFLNEDSLMCIEAIHMFYFSLLNIECETQREKPTASCDTLRSFVTLRSLFHIYMKVLQDQFSAAILFPTVLTCATAALPKISQFLNNDSLDSKELVNFGLILANVGIFAYKKYLYAEATPFLSWSCKLLLQWCRRFNEVDFKLKITEVHLDNKYSMLISCLRKTESHAECLKLLMEIIPLYSNSSFFVAHWVGVKYEMKNVKYGTIYQALRQVKHNLSDDDMYRLLNLELTALKQQRYNTQKDIYLVVKDMLAVSRSTNNVTLNYCISLLELVQIQWATPSRGEKSAQSCCEEVINLLTGRLGKLMPTDDDSGIKSQLARAYYWNYLTELQLAKEIARDEMFKQSLQKLECVSAQQGDEEDNNTVNDEANCVNMTLDKDFQNISLLNSALDLWKELIEDNEIPPTNYEQVLIDLQATAEIFSLSRQDMQETVAWSLACQLSANCGINDVHVICSSRLVHQLCGVGNFQEANRILQSVKSYLPKLNDEKNDCFPRLRYELALAEYLFYAKDISAGIKIICSVWHHPYLEKKSRRATLIKGELKMLVSQYIRIPAFHQMNLVKMDLPWGKSNAIEIAIQGMQCFTSLAKLIDKEMQPYDSPGLTYYVTSSLMNIHLTLTNLFIEIGAPREARWFLTEQLNNSHRLALNIKRLEFLFGLAQLDFQSENCDRCRTKLQAILNQLQPELKNKMEIGKPTTKNADLLFPEFIKHPDDCECCKCQVPILHRLTFRMLLLHVELLADSGFTHEAVCFSRRMLELARKKSCTDLSISLTCEVRLIISRLLFAQKYYAESRIIAEDGIKELKAMKYNYNNIFTLLSYLIYQKGIGYLNSVAKQKNLEPLHLLDSLWTVEKKGEIGIPVGKFQNKIASSFREPLSPIRPSQPKQEVHTLQNDVNVLSKRLWNAPSRKSRPILDRWAKFEEPPDVEDEVIPSQKKIADCNVKVPVFDPDIFSSESYSDDENCAGESKEVQNFLYTPLTQNSNANRAIDNSEIGEGRQLRSRTIRNKQISQPPTMPRSKSTTKVKKEPMPQRVTRSRQARSKNSENAENERNDLNTSTGFVQDFDLNVSVVSSSDEDSVGIECEIAPVEIFRGGKGLKRVGQKKIEDVELFRHVDENAFQQATKTGSIVKVEICEDSELNIDRVRALMEEALALIAHHPVCPLYSNLCLLLALLYGPNSLVTGHYLSESNFVTLRHQGLTTYGKKLNTLTVTDDNHARLLECYDILNFSSKVTKDKSLSLSNNLKNLPDDWAVCQISFIPDVVHGIKSRLNQPLLLGRYEKYCKPVFLKVPTANYKEDDVPRTLLQEFESIIEDSKDTMKSDNRVVWWETRRALDVRMKNFVTDLEDVWIGYWKGVFLGRPVSKEDQQRLTLATKEILRRVGRKCSVGQQQLEIFLDSVPWLKDDQFHAGIIDLFGITGTSTEVNTVGDLIKTQLASVKSKEMNRCPVVLILGKEVECLPWESMPILRNIEESGICLHRPVTRMPSLSVLLSHLAWQTSTVPSVFQRGVNREKTYFVLNPSNDLTNTQTVFEVSFINEEKWTGVVARPPTESEFSSGLTSHDLFVYCGHGSGSRYLSGDAVQRLHCTAVTLLMGCSSGKLRPMGRGFDPSGSVLQYLLAGCPSIVADLWDVTDRDIDRYLEQVLKLWLPSTNLCNVTTKARGICRLPFLIGAAPVVYGLPVRMK